MPTYDNRVLFGARETSPIKTADGGGDAFGRGTTFGEQVVAPLSPDFHALEGKFFCGTTVPTTGGTGVAGHPAPVLFEGVKPYILFKNNNAVGGAKILLKRISLRYTAIGAGGTLPRYWTCVDPQTNRYTSGGTQITPTNPNAGAAVASGALIYHGAVVAPVASANVRTLQTGQLRPVVPVIFDEVHFRFGEDASAGAPAVLSGTLVAQQTIMHVPVILLPGDTFLLSLWRVSQSGADSLEADMSWIER